MRLLLLTFLVMAAGFGMAVVVPAAAEVQVLQLVAAQMAAAAANPQAKPRPWREIARPEQLMPPGPWGTWYVRGGRGAGKTRTGAESLAELILENPPGQYAIVAPTFADARDTCVEDESGLLRALGGLGGPHIRQWNRSTGELFLRKGSIVRCDGADDGALRIQGKNLRAVWADEPGLWAKRQWKRAWDESIAFALRISPAKAIVTGTPKVGHPLPKMLLNDPDVVNTFIGTTYENEANLDPVRLERLRKRFEGTRLGQQELLGKLIDDAEGALWSRLLLDLVRVSVDRVCMLDEHRVTESEGWHLLTADELALERAEVDGGAEPASRAMTAEELAVHTEHFIHIERSVVAVDPAGSSTEGSDETGIVATGTAMCPCGGLRKIESTDPMDERWEPGGRPPEVHGFVLADRSGRYSPGDWAHVAVQLRTELDADRIVAEMNFGGDMVKTTVAHEDRDVPFAPVNASRGKAVRAEPVSALTEQGKLHIVGSLEVLEDQMCLAADSLVNTPRGDVPIAAIRVGDLVRTRAGYRRVTWAGQTGVAPLLELAASDGRSLRLTATHPVFIEGRGFVPACEVQSGDKLRVCHSQSNEPSSSSRVNATSATMTATSRQAGRAVAESSIATSGRQSTDRSLPAFTSTTSTTTEGTTRRRILQRFRSAITCWLTTPANDSVRPSRPPKIAGPRMLPGGQRGHIGSFAARSAAPNAERGACESRGSAPVTITHLGVPSSPEPVYNLTVEGAHEFFANGILVHNCNFTIGDGGPATDDRVDGLVWGVTYLMIGTHSPRVRWL